MKIKYLVIKFIQSWRKAIFHLAFIIHTLKAHWNKNILVKIAVFAAIAVLEITLALVSFPFYLIYHPRKVYAFARGITTEKAQIYHPNYYYRRRHGLLGMVLVILVLFSKIIVNVAVLAIGIYYFEPQATRASDNSVSGVVFDDQNSDGIQDAGEDGLSGWTVSLSGSALLESVNVAVNGVDPLYGSDGTNSVNPLISGRKYLFVASGEWNGCDNPWWCGLADGSNDAEYQVGRRSEWDAYLKDGTLGYIGASNNQGDLMINDTLVDWGPYHDDHIYSYVFTGVGGAVNFSVMDGKDDIKIPVFYGDNSFLGIPPDKHIKVDIYELVNGVANQQITDSNGNYVFPNVPDGDYQIYLQQARGWLPTSPASGSHSITVAGSGINGNNFGIRGEGKRFSVAKEVLDLDGGDLLQGDTLEYKIFLDNIAPVRYFYGVYFTDNLPSGLAYEAGSAEILDGPIGSRVCALNAGTFSVIGATISASWDSYDDPFAPGASACFRFRATVNDSVPNGTAITNSADITTFDAGRDSVSAHVCVLCKRGYSFPKNCSISINNGQSCTDSREVTLSLQAEQAAHVIVSKNSDFYDAEWEPFTSPMEKNWTLEGGEETKTVYAMFKSSDGNLSFPNLLSSTIEYRPAGCGPKKQPPILNSGDLIKGTFDAVYYYGSDSKRHAFPNRGTYDSWYNGDFSKVKIISDTQLGSIALGNNMTYKPGVRMIKLQYDPRVYAVDENAVLRFVTSESVAWALYGENWSKFIDDLSDAFFINYTIGEPIYSLADSPANLLPAKSSEALKPQCSSSINFTQTLSRGSSGPEALELQKLLRCLGYFPTNIEVSGYFGEATYGAVIKFQQANGLEQVGVVGPQTRDLLNKY
jgi:N-acetylmuramoyl-L-alanine amidase